MSRRFFFGLVVAPLVAKVAAEVVLPQLILTDYARPYYLSNPLTREQLDALEGKIARQAKEDSSFLSGMGWSETVQLLPGDKYTIEGIPGVFEVPPIDTSDGAKPQSGIKLSL